MAILIECPNCKYRNSENREYYTKDGKRKRERVGALEETCNRGTC